MAERVRIGIFGCGNIMRRFHLPQYPKIPEAQVVGLYDTSPGRAESAKEMLQSLLAQQSQTYLDQGDSESAARCEKDQQAIVAYDDADVMLANVGAVDVAVPPVWHCPCAQSVLERGLDVMVEKPMARTWWEAARIADTVRGAKGIYQHNENWVYTPTYQLIKALLDGGSIGRVERVVWFQSHVGPGPFVPFWFCDSQSAGGGSLTDWGVHSVCTAWYLAGFEKAPTKVRSDGIAVKAHNRVLGGRLQELKVEDDAVIEVTLEDPETGAETLLLVEGTWSRFASAGKASVIRVEGTRGEIEVEGNGFGREETVHVRTRFAGERCQSLACGLGSSLMDESFLHEIRNFVVCSAERKNPVVSYDIGLTVMSILGAGYLSEIRDRQAVTLGDFRSFCSEYGDQYPDDQAAGEIIRYLMRPYQ